MVTSRIAIRLLLGASAAALALPAAAQESRTAEEIIVTAQRENATGVERGGSAGVLGDKPAEDIPFSIRSYDETLIRNQQPYTLGQVLENDPTVRTSYGFANAAEQFVIRGFALAGDDVGFDGLYGITPRQLIAPELYQSVQVLNGASAFLNGAAPGGSGIGGSVNLIPKRATDDPLARVSAIYNSDEHFGGSFDIGRRFGAGGAWGVRLNGAFRSGDVSITDEFRETAVLGGAIDYAAGPLRLSLDLAYQRVEVRRLRPKLTVNGVVPRVPDADVNYGQPWQETTLRDIFGQFRAEYDLGENAMLYAAFGARDGSESGVYSSLTLLDADTGAASVSSSFIPRTDNNEAATAGLRAKLAHGGISHEVNFGGSMNWLVNRNAYEFYAVSPVLNNIYDPIVVPRSTTVTFAGGDLDDPFPISRTRLGSAFASDTIGLWNDRILATAGLRLQTITATSYSAFTEEETGEYSESAVTPVFGLVVKPTNRISLYGNYIEALVQGATAPASGANPDGGGTLPVRNAGEVLSPTRSEQIEVGAKYIAPRFSAGIALFRTDRAIAILTPDPDSTDMLVFGPFGIQRHRGIEVSFEAEPLDGLRLIAGGSVIDAKLRRTQGGVNEGNQAVGVPEYLVNANAEWDLPFARGLTLTGRVVHTGEQPANIANTLFLEDWTRFDLGARYVAVAGNMPLTLRFSVDNVANARYWASAFDSFRPDLLQGAPRTFKLSASLEL
ncbi:TonB-dependent receptor [Sphingosinithalassobacter sp. CS137]|uniref:TonB-dependent receptor n=1 Tax=Sphingosinithalassobacter sp. CS137 TaxID=2762748 RepID=UPI00165E8D5D|nr:TonB-dependent receptor [Sphingosinithalassobacter sp. CS137]